MKKITVSGYKSIAAPISISLPGLTVLAGQNSSGKSSFMQPLLLIKQTLESDYEASVFVLNGPNVNITDKEQIIPKIQMYTVKKLEITVSNDNQSVSMCYKYNKNGINFEHVMVKNDLFRRGLKINIPRDQNSPLRITNKKLLHIATQIVASIDKQETISVDKIEPIKLIKERCLYRITLNAKAKVGTDSYIDIPMPLVSSSEQIKNMALGLIHVPGLRSNPERLYNEAFYEEHFPGTFDKYTAAIINRWEKDKKSKEKHDLLQKHMKYLELASFLESSRIDDSHIEIKVSRAHSNSTDKTLVNIADVGFGVSQVLPIIVALISAGKDQLVYIEQPELHLHPKAQLYLAKIFSEAVNRGVVIVVETHSSIFIRGIQTSVAAGSLDFNKVSLCWFSQESNGQTICNESSLDRFGAFGDWPEDFDDTYFGGDKGYLDAVESAMEKETL